MHCDVAKGYGAANEPEGLYGGPWVVHTNHGGSVMQSKGLGYGRRAHDGIRPGRHANAGAGCTIVSKPQEMWAGNGACECEGV